VTLQVRRDPDPARFHAEALRFLVRDEAGHGLLLSILDGIDRGRWPQAERALVLRDGRIVAVALRTPPHDLVLSDVDDPEPDVVARALADAQPRDRHDVAGVLGPDVVAGAFAAAWHEATGTPVRVRRRMRIHRLDAVSEVPAVDGVMRRAAPSDRARVRAWLEAFRDEANPDDPADLDATAERLTSGASADLRFWTVAGRPVAMAAAVGPTPGGIRISAVYTPPEERRRGYATALVAALSHAQLQGGRRFCLLYTDLANPTSNAIYRRIGYRPVRDDTHWAFVAVDGTG
jgi:predicted GNAT family acetyltransferase